MLGRLTKARWWESSVHWFLDTTDHISLSNVLIASCNATFARYTLIFNLMISNQGVLHLFLSVTVDEPVLEAQSITHLDDASAYIRTEKNISLTIQVPDTVVKNDRNPSFLHARACYPHAMSLLCEHQNLHMERTEVEFATFASLL